MLSLTPAQQRELRAQAHHLSPVVTIAQNGLTDSVLKEIDNSLKAHELIKIRVVTDEREARKDYLNTICTTLEAAPVQQIGKLLVVYRHNPEKHQLAAQTRAPRREPRRTKRSYQ